MNDEEKRGYEAQQEHSYRSEYDGDYEYRQGWAEGEREDRRECERKEERRQEEEYAEQLEERRCHEARMIACEEEQQQEIVYQEGETSQVVIEIVFRYEVTDSFPIVCKREWISFAKIEDGYSVFDIWERVRAMACKIFHKKLEEIQLVSVK